ncbi:sodium-coupled transporter [Sporosarcina pasteurii]|uniref:Na(+)/dicarboxylate symporter n=2 Tax=Sporosarcina pasteurii TaxID=1474 RepID=A0A380CDX0_SPOPA|nr:sodium-coupled transporter [Sporosarcina pasteurii]SUJ18440.1 Na(+)/dicarboxylate symporter [Sporosarcina pasteurii]
MQLLLTFSILGVTIVLFMTNRLRADLVALLALLAFVVTGILQPAEALSGFSNSVVIMIAALFVVGAGILRTGLAQMAGNLLLRYAGDSEKRLFLLLLLIVAFVGAFMSNTGTVALMMPIVVSIAIRIGSSPSKYLLPLSYVASFSGLLTLIASPPNLIVSQMLLENGFERLSFFQITPIGLIGVAIGIMYLYMVRNRVVPKEARKGSGQSSHTLSPKRLARDYALGGKLLVVKVPPASAIVGKRLTQLKIPVRFQLCVLKIKRKSLEGTLKFLPMTFHEMAGPLSAIEGNDILYIQGTKEQATHFAEAYGLELLGEPSEPEELVSKELGIAEVLLTPNSSLINQDIRAVGFREKYNLNIIGLKRQGKQVMQDVTKLRLRFGDALLVQGTWDAIELLARETNDVVVVGQPQEHASTASANGKAWVAGMIMVLMVVLMIAEVFPAFVTVLIAAVLMVLTGCVRNMNDAYGQINWESIVLIAAMLPMATALEKSGGMQLLADGIIQLLGGFGAIGVLAGIYFMTMLFGQFISNTATAVLFAPIALNAAMALGANPYAFLIIVAVGASMSFATPVASPTNALVMTAGGYSFRDFAKIGVPLQLIMFIVMMIAVPLLFPL